MANGQEDSLLNGRMRSYIIGLSFVASLLGWGFTLGITYSQVQSNSTEINTLREANYGERLASIESMLQQIRYELRQSRYTYSPQEKIP